MLSLSADFIRPGLTVLLAITLCGGSTRASYAEQRYVSPDKAITFAYPQKWKVDDTGGKLRLTAPDDAHYTVTRELLPGQTDDPANDEGLQASAKKAAVRILPGALFISAQPITMEHGQGAAFRFQKSATDDTSLEVWIGVVGKQVIVVAPDKMKQPNQTIGLSSLFESLASGSVPPAPIRPAASTAVKPTGNLTAPGLPQGSGATIVGQNGGLKTRAVRGQTGADGMEVTPSHTLLEGYAGHLRYDDNGFALHILDGGVATAEWSGARNNAAHYTGTYTGSTGNYTVLLTLASGSVPFSNKTLSLDLNAQGGSEYGRFNTDVYLSKRAIADIALTEEGGTLNHGVGKPGGTGAGARANAGTNSNKNTSRRTTPRRTNRTGNPRGRFYPFGYFR